MSQYTSPQTGTSIREDDYDQQDGNVGDHAIADQASAVDMARQGPEGAAENLGQTGAVPTAKGVAPSGEGQNGFAPSAQEYGVAPSAQGTRATHSLLGDLQGFRRQWESVQVGFVDDPRRAVEAAEKLVSSVIDEIVRGFRQQRETLERQWSDGGEASTDDLRSAFQRYRDFFDRLLQV